MNRGKSLVLCAIAISLALPLVYLAAGGSSYAPAKVQDPCKRRPWRNPEGIQEIVQQFSLSALDGAACELGVSRERLARALATPQSREAFARRFHIGDAQLAKAIRAGLLRAVSDAEAAGALPPLIGEPLRSTLRRVPLEEGIELIRNARSLLDRFQTYLGPAQGMLEQVLP
ncbi:MAG TPA: hypothetical protein VFP23_03375 [Solirubrobacterales bacterium]|nr:hypothetical protein [Solirubrobacterales bacterium]